MLLYAGSWPFESHHTGFFLKGIRCLVLLSGGYQALAFGSRHSYLPLIAQPPQAFPRHIEIRTNDLKWSHPENFREFVQK